MLGSSKPAPRSAWFTLTALTVLGAAFRLYGLGRDSFWMDELIRVTEARMDTFEHLREFLRGDVHPPGYVMLLHAVNRWFGQEEWNFRLPSALAGIAVIPVIFLLGRRLYSHREGLVAAALTAVLWCPISYSQEAAPYMILVLITAGATCFWLPMIDDLRRTGRLRFGFAAGYAACATLGYYTHFFGIGFFGLQALYGFWLCRKSFRALGLLLGVYVASVIGFGWWLPDFLTQLTSKHATATWMKPPSDTYFFRQVRYFFNREHAFAWLAFAAYLFLIVNAVRAGKARGTAMDQIGNGAPKNTEDAPTSFWDAPGALLALWMIVPFAVVFAVSKLGKPMLQERYLLICMAPAYLLFARAVVLVGERTAGLPRKMWVQAGLTAALCAAFLGHLILGKHYYDAPRWTQFREAIQCAVDERAAAPDATFSFGYIGAGLDYTDYYFDRFHGERLRFSGGTAADLPRLDEVLGQSHPKRVVFLRAHVDADAAFLDGLKQRLMLVKTHEFAGATVWVLERRGP